MQNSGERHTGNAYAVIMAGGRGERFWPQSRLSHPKQLLRLLGNLTLIELTAERLQTLFDPSRIIVITNDDYVAPMRSLMSNIPGSNIIGEPAGRDTAPCAALAAAYIRSVSKEENPLICLLPADHLINDVQAFTGVIQDSLDLARASGRFVTIGVKPTFASTGYGYIETAEALNYSFRTKFNEGCSFKEKPDAELAEKYLASGRYKWNSGIFIMPQDSLLRAFEQHAPDLSAFYEDLLDYFMGEGTKGVTLEDIYGKVRKISIDYAIMEKVKNLAVAECTFDWDDVGSWTSMRNQIRPESNNNVVRGLHLGIDTKDCIVVGTPKHLIATVDIEDTIIVHTEDATLVCNGKSAQRIKELVQLIASKPELESFL